MRIGAYESSSFLEFTPLLEISSHSFNLLASVDGRQVLVDSLYFSSETIQSFIGELGMIRRHWSGVATLAGTYDFQLQVHGLKPEQLWVSIHAVDYISFLPMANLSSCRLILDAGFPLQDAAAVRLFEEFNELFPH